MDGRTGRDFLGAINRKTIPTICDDKGQRDTEHDQGRGLAMGTLSRETSGLGDEGAKRRLAILV